MKKLSSLILALALLFTLGSCAKGSDTQKEATASPSPTATAAATKTADNEGGSLAAIYSTEPETFDPYLVTAADTRSLLFNIFEGLVKPDSNGDLQPAVAESYKISSDSTTYTFTLRSGVKFSTGKDVTAQDVKYSLETATAAGVKGLDKISAVNIVDASTIEIVLTAADADFLPYLTVAIVPADYTNQASSPVGTGPFTLKSYSPQESIVLARNEYYWQEGRPYLDEVVLKYVTEANQLLSIQSGSADFVSGVDPSKASEVDTSKYTLIERKSNSVQTLILNNASEPFNNELVRQAISYIIDPDEIISTVRDGIGYRVGTPVIPNLATYYNASLEKAYSVNIDKAKELLSKAGYANGFTFTITVPSNYTVHVDTAQVIASELSAVGITAQIEQVDWATWLSQVYTNREYQSTVISVDGSTLTPKSFLGRYVSTDGSNFINYNNPEYDTLYAKAAAELDQTNRVKLFNQLQQILSDTAASVYLQDIESYVALSNSFSGYQDYPLYVTDYSTIYQVQ